MNRNLHIISINKKRSPAAEERISVNTNLNDDTGSRRTCHEAATPRVKKKNNANNHDT
jgi:predicted protein tyrosine phosphatase